MRWPLRHGELKIYLNLWRFGQYWCHPDEQIAHALRSTTPRGIMGRTILLLLALVPQVKNTVVKIASDATVISHSTLGSQK